MNVCKHCGDGLIPASRWRKMPAAAKQEARRNNMARKGREDACHRCDRRSGTAITRSAHNALTAEATQARLEDIAFMADCGESLSGAASRLGIGVSGLEAWLKAHDAKHLTDALRVNEPRDHNRYPDASLVTHLGARYGRSGSAA